LVSLPGVGQRFGNNNFRTAVPGPPAPTPRGSPPKTQIRLARDDGARFGNDVDDLLPFLNEFKGYLDDSG
jgi:hypothetical protein